MHTVHTLEDWLSLKITAAIASPYPSYSQGFEKHLQFTERYLQLSDEDLGGYPRGSLGRVLCYRKRYREGLPLFSRRDSLDTLEYDGPSQPEQIMTLNLNFPRQVSE